jgi:YcaO-like protein with predicted kinase domain
VSAPRHLRGEPLRSPRPAGHHRRRPAAETLEVLRPHLPGLGITRLADITGLDRVGLPVTLAIRPNGKVLSVSAGKGLTPEAALVSGAMEAVELSCAENLDLPSLRAAEVDLDPGRQRVSAAEVPRRALAPTPSRWPLSWVTGWDIVRGVETLAPRASVSLDPQHSGLSELHAFHATSNGLASGNDLTEAILSALFELVERDAVALHSLTWRHRGRRPSALDLQALPWPAAQDMADRLRAAHLLPVVLDLRVDTELPVYACWLLDEASPEVGVYKGYGCHLDPEVALVRALTEAAQSRLVAIAGSRDDLFRTQAAELRDAANALTASAWARSLPRRAPVVHPDLRADSTHADLEVVLERLGAVGLDRVVVFDLTRPGLPVRAVKVLVPGLEHLDATLSTLSPRGLRVLGGL